MNANDYLNGAFKLLLAASPFVMVMMSVVYADEIIHLVKRAVLGRGRAGDY